MKEIESSVMKITPAWNFLPTFSRSFPPAKITMFTVTGCPLQGHKFRISSS